MGKYSPSHVRPRPLLVKLLRTTEVSLILSNRSKLTKSKVYMWTLKVKATSFLNGSVHGSVQGSSFSLNVQNSIQVSSDSHVDVDPVAHAVVQGERVNKGAGYGL